ncbi:ATP-binding protein [Mycolicibacterium fluoranthenivorans]|uniref:Adenylate and Guanylate cyclase catalytic domain-containing protein n=1 Tax=Mycolicibacterium fluoranthenivorans TaxID=258505 RepID=A0A1G4V4T2_9MYCO|nr:AAA family ATPase [Mycolicibacterium fluoranthenivorans]SCX01155.1 Adenylate and Guanylate cyclase catalytic domain-containing protein [Mycolicibacterium fluoranthenivorans]
MSHGGTDPACRTGLDAGPSIDALLDQAVAAINRGDRVTAAALADHVLAIDHRNADAEDLLAAPDQHGEIRRLTILYVDLVDSATISGSTTPDTYGLMAGGYRRLVLEIVNRYDGHIDSPTGEGLLAVFGHPRAHEDDVHRAVLGGLAITREVALLGEQFRHRFGVEIAARAGIHRGLVYLDTVQNDVYGLGANLAARVAGLAPPGAVVISDTVAPLIGNAFELVRCEPAAVKGVAELIAHYRVLGERAPQAHARTPLVGRHREFGRLRERWEQAQAGVLAVPGVVVRGEPGIGKSALADAIARVAADAGATVVTLAGSALHTDAGLYPIQILLEQHCAIGRLIPPDERLRLLRTELKARERDSDVPLLAPVLSIAPEHGYQAAAAEGHRLYELIGQAVRGYLLACIGDGPGMVVVEDAHWLDPSTIDVLESLLDAAGGRLLVVMTGRPGSWLPADWPVTEIDLGPLTESETDTLIATLDPTLSADVRSAVARRCDGLPFYVEQVVSGLTGAGVPEGLYEPLLARLRASADVVPVVEAAALIGRQVDRDVLSRVVDLSDDVLDGVLAELHNARVLEPWGTTGWRFRHELLRELATELAPPSVRRGLHGKVADALVSGVGTDPEWPLVATHYEQAANPVEAVSAYRRASTQARRRGALTEARGYLTRALAQVDTQAAGRPHDMQEMSVRLERGFLASAAEGPRNDATAADFEECLRLGGADVRDDDVVGTLFALAGYYFALGDLPRCARVLRSLRSELNDGREYFRPVVDACVGIGVWMNGGFRTARSQIAMATAEFAAASRQPIEALWFAPTDPITMAHGILGLDRLACGDLSGAQAQVLRAADRAEELSFPQGPFSLAFARFFEIWICIETRQLDRAATLATGLVQHAELHGFEVWTLWGAAQLAIVDAMRALTTDEADADLLRDRLARAIELVRIVRGAGLTVFITMFDGALAQLLCAACRFDEARAQLDTALTLGRDIDMSFYEAELLRLRAHTQADADARDADLSAARDIARRQGADLYELRCALDDYEMHGEPARAELDDVAGRMAAQSRLPERQRYLAVR